MSELFSEKEAAEILQRAVALQETGGGEDRPYQPGVTKEELYRIAREAGVDPSFVDLALQKPSVNPAAKARPTGEMDHERVIEGELPLEHFDILLEDITSASSVHRQVGRTFDATTWLGFMRAQITVSARQGRTRVKVKTDSTGPFLCTIFPAFFAGIIGLGIGSAAAGPLVGLAVLIGIAGIAGWSFQALLRKGHKRGAELADRLAAKIADETRHVRERLAASSSATAEPLSDEEHLEASH